SGSGPERVLPAILAYLCKLVLLFCELQHDHPRVARVSDIPGWRRIQGTYHFSLCPYGAFLETLQRKNGRQTRTCASNDGRLGRLSRCWHSLCLVHYGWGVSFPAPCAWVVNWLYTYRTSCIPFRHYPGRASG